MIQRFYVWVCIWETYNYCLDETSALQQYHSNQAECQSTDEWVKKIWCVRMFVYMYSGYFYRIFLGLKKEGNPVICDKIAQETSLLTEVLLVRYEWCTVSCRYTYGVGLGGFGCVYAPWDHHHGHDGKRAVTSSSLLACLGAYSIPRAVPDLLSVTTVSLCFLEFYINGIV